MTQQRDSGNYFKFESWGFSVFVFSYGAFVIINEPMLIHYYQVTSIVCINVLQCVVQLYGFFFLIFIGVQLNYTVAFISAVQQSEPTLFQIIFLYRSLSVLSRIPRATQLILISYLLFTQQCVCVSEFPWWLNGEELHVGDMGYIPGSGRSPEEGNDNPLLYSCLGNCMDRGALQVTQLPNNNNNTYVIIAVP